MKTILKTLAIGAIGTALTAGAQAVTVIGSLPATLTVNGETYVLASDLNLASGNGITIKTHNITLDGNGFKITNTGGSGNGVVIDASPSTITNVTVKNLEIDNFSVGFRIIRTRESTIQDNTIINANRGFLHFLAPNNVVTDNTATGRAGACCEGTRIEASSGNLLYAGNLFTGFLNSSNGKGVYLASPSPGSVFLDNVIEGNRIGVDLIGSDLLFDGNSISFNSNRGVNGRAPTTVSTFINNTIDGNGERGMLLRQINDSLIQDNLIANNVFDGIYLNQAGLRNTITGNTIVSNGFASAYGLFIVSSARDNLIYNNYFMNRRNARSHLVDNSNTWNVAATAGPNIVNCPSIGGNYWANLTGTGPSETCTDANADGFCDTSYTITAPLNVDLLPLVFCTPGVPCDSFEADLLAALCASEEADAATSLAELGAIGGAIIDDLLDGEVISDLTEAECREALLALLQ